MDAKTIEQRLTNVRGIEAANVETILPCTPTQESMLMKNSDGFYYVEMMFEVHSLQQLDVSLLKEAWHHTMKRHSALRTIFTNSTLQAGQSDMIVLKNARSTLVEALPAGERPTIDIRSSVAAHPDFDAAEPPHRLIIQRLRNGRTFMKLEISHAITDGVSLANAFRDLISTYDNQSSGSSAPQFIQYYQHLTAQAVTDTTYWQRYCIGAVPCFVPISSKASKANRQLLTTDIEHTGSDDILALCKQTGVSIANLFHAVWSLVLKLNVPACNDAIFGYLVSGRDIEMESIESCVGALISALISRQHLHPATTVAQFLAQIRDDSARSLNKKYCDLKKINEGKPLFNTAINFR
jgi:hypothetical protein